MTLTKSHLIDAISEQNGLGTIILPRPLPEPVIDEVLDWPSQ